jgi:glycine cleavage system P protein (glycine dehydrogenase) subunit 2
MKLIFERSQPGRRAGTLPTYPDLPRAEIPEELRRAAPPRLPELAEPELVRHFTELSTRNFGIDTGFYPLGSCTMKHNPRVNERLVMLPGFRDLHPHQEERDAQGALELMWRLQEILVEVSGLDACSLQPAAGSQGELTGLMLMRAYFADRGEGDVRDTIVTADTAHGTNPASVTMAGYKLQKVRTDERGNLDVAHLRELVDEHTAGLMLTNPSTLGLFDEHIEEVAAIFHDAGALLYYDGANLNAVCGISRPGDMGFDIVHINLHKTFSQPHGGGGPGGGPIVVRERLEPFLPVPAVVRDGDEFRLDYDRPKSIGKVRGFTGPFGVFVRSYAYIRSYGPRLREMSEVAVLNANYLLARLKDTYDLPFDRLCMHEFVLSARSLKREHGIAALDVAKRLMDYGFHPPTVYFPLVVPEALMIEPTETEPKERLDSFVDAMLAIAAEAAEDPEVLRSAPHGRPVGRLDEVRAAKQPIVKYGFEEHPETGPVAAQDVGEPRQLEAQKGA